MSKYVIYSGNSVPKSHTFVFSVQRKKNFQTTQ